ncbi:hypothetical protein C1645_833242 [Glomus cerebriforme]|uniref:Reelin domain-containing protein n=1 Tax=Glomus cerebriforme TaxID=658196 RepID=A0A397SI13_9GLOM|nr:hypothetical protein C1645_833242 [Glomus cerebriforme]
MFFNIIMKKYSFLSAYVVGLIVLYIGSITTNAAVGNICTSASIKELSNVITKGVKVKVKEKGWVPGSKIYVKIDVGKKNSIRNLIIWAETVDGEQPGVHIGHWSPISDHAYVDGCNGLAVSTITNQVDLNLSQITYKWNPPNAQDYEPTETSVTPIPSITQSFINATKITSATIVPSISSPRGPQAITTTSIKNQYNSTIKSIIFKGVLQLMNHPDSEIYFFKSHVIKRLY